MLSLLCMPSWLATFLSILVAILVLLLMITVHELGHYIAGRILKFKINEFAIGFGKPLFRRIGKKTGQAFSIRILPLGGYCAFEGEDTESPDPGAFNMQKPWKRLIVLFCGPLMNFLFALLVVIISFQSYGQFLLQTSSVLPDASDSQIVTTEEMRLQKDDIIVSVNGKEIYINTDLTAAVKELSVNEYADVEVIRGGERKTVKVLFRKYEYETKNQEGETVKSQAVGFGITLTSVNHRFGFFESLGRSFVYIFKMFVETVKLPVSLVTGALGVNDIGGPITTITMTAEFAQMGFNYLLEIIAMIGISLAVFNLFPIPALDGARMVFTTIEWIRGKPINRKVEGYIHAIGLVLLFGLIIIIDLLHFL